MKNLSAFLIPKRDSSGKTRPQNDRLSHGFRWSSRNSNSLPSLREDGPPKVQNLKVGPSVCRVNPVVILNEVKNLSVGFSE